MSEDKRELAINEALRLLKIAEHNENWAHSYLRDTSEYNNWQKIENVVYYPGSRSGHWRDDYSTFEEALQSEKEAWDKLCSTPEYKAYKEAHIELQKNKKSFEEAKESDKKYFESSRS